MVGYLSSVWRRLEPAQLVAPALEQARGYRRPWLARDLIAALTIVAVLVPQGLAYGELAGLPPVAGLYAALFPLLLYPVFASSRRLMVGPESGLAILTATALAPLAVAQTSRYEALAAMLALMVGAIMIVGGMFRLGILADFLSRPVLIGFMNGVAVILVASQLPRLFGISVHAESALGKIWGVITNLGETSWRTLVLGLVLIGVLALVGRLGPKVPGALVVLLVGGAAVVALNLDQKGVSIIGTVPKGLPGLTYPNVGLADFGALLPLAAGLALVGFSEAILTARAFAEKHGETVDADHELIAMGIGNAGVGFTQGFPTSASQSRTAVADTSGMRTQLAQMLAAVAVGIFLLFFTGILKNVPQVALAAIVIYAALGLFEERQLRALYRADRTEFGLAIATFVGVVVFGIMTGILVAVGLSLAVFLGGVVRPHDAVLGPVDGVDGFQEVSARGAEAAPGVVVYRFDGPLFFANADYFLTRSLRLVESRSLHCFVLDLEAVTTIDVTAARAVEKLRSAVVERGASFFVARATLSLRRHLRDMGLAQAIGEENFYPSVRTAVEAAGAR
ncbi:MAG: SulP family inorganic anion transporter [Gaiellaceae bacterium]